MASNQEPDAFADFSGYPPAQARGCRNTVAPAADYLLAHIVPGAFSCERKYTVTATGTIGLSHPSHLREADRSELGETQQATVGYVRCEVLRLPGDGTALVEIPSVPPAPADIIRVNLSDIYHF